ncbi:hypothetical protein [Lachnobacterium bovis]|uniref:hypothetical protein n=1 Tax=Lachnobacterium bovis TaxID=140626 RepID=UPI001865926C|nr:hypothetical protein [Lachnobacterium bovis]
MRCNDDLNDKKFDKIFMNYPFGMRLRNLPETDYIQELYERVPEIKKATISRLDFTIC